MKTGLTSLMQDVLLSTQENEFAVASLEGHDEEIVIAGELEAAMEDIDTLADITGNLEAIAASLESFGDTCIPEVGVLAGYVIDQNYRRVGFKLNAQFETVSQESDGEGEEKKDLVTTAAPKADVMQKLKAFAEALKRVFLKAYASIKRFIRHLIARANVKKNIETLKAIAQSKLSFTGKVLVGERSAHLLQHPHGYDGLLSALEKFGGMQLTPDTAAGMHAMAEFLGKDDPSTQDAHALISALQKGIPTWLPEHEQIEGRDARTSGYVGGGVKFYAFNAKLGEDAKIVDRLEEIADCSMVRRHQDEVKVTSQEVQALTQAQLDRFVAITGKIEEMVNALETAEKNVTQAEEFVNEIVENTSKKLDGGSSFVKKAVMRHTLRAGLAAVHGILPAASHFQNLVTAFAEAASKTKAAEKAA